MIISGGMGGTGGVQTEAPGLAARDGRGRGARPHQSAATKDTNLGQFGLQVGVKIPGYQISLDIETFKTQRTRKSKSFSGGSLV